MGALSCTWFDCCQPADNIYPCSICAIGHMTSWTYRLQQFIDSFNGSNWSEPEAHTDSLCKPNLIIIRQNYLRNYCLLHIFAFYICLFERAVAVAVCLVVRSVRREKSLRNVTLWHCDGNHKHKMMWRNDT